MATEETNKPKGAYGRSRLEIAEAAVDCFERKGFADTTVDEIVAAAGYAQRTFYRQFASKEEVIFYDLPEIVQPIEKLLGQHLKLNQAWAAVCEIVTDNGAQWDAQSDHLARRRAQLMYREPQLHRRFLEIASTWEEILTRVFAEALNTDPAVDIYANLLATVVVGACRTGVRLWVADPEVRLGPATAGGLDVAGAGFGLARRRPRA